MSNNTVEVEVEAEMGIGLITNLPVYYEVEGEVKEVTVVIKPINDYQI